jgi:hypothetical protein
MFKWLLALIPATCLAVDLEVAVGQSSYCCKVDGVWYQSPFGFQANTRPTSFEIGARQRIGDFGLHVAYVDLGTVTADNVASMRDDEFGKHDFSKPCVISGQHNCLGFFKARQNVSGVLAGVSYGRDFRGIRLEGEVGSYFYRSSWSVNIQCPACGNVSLYSFGYSHNFRYLSDVRRTNYVSARVVYKSAFLMVRRFSTIDGSGSSDEQYAIGMTSGPVNQVMLGYTF